MSLSGVNESYLPNLPGFRSREVPSGIKKHYLKLVDGGLFVEEEVLPKIAAGALDDNQSQFSTSLGSTTSSLNMRPKIRPTVENINVILAFHAYFIENISYSSTSRDSRRVRKCTIFYYCENGMVSVAEKSQQNSGIPQGTLVRKDYILKADNTPIVPEDLLPGQTIEIYRREYHIAGCDEATKKYLRRVLNIQDIAELPVPSDLHEEYRQTLEKGPSDDWNKYRAKKNDSKVFVEAALGNSVNNAGREGFLKYGELKLKFRCIWDNSSSLYGDISEYFLVYHLSDDTAEIYSIVTPNSGFDQFNRLLKRSRLLKDASAVPSLAEDRRSKPYYKWNELYIGLDMNIYSRQLRVVDADSFTREFYRSKNLELGPSLRRREVPVTIHEREIPPPTGFGSDEDSLRSCFGSLQITAPRYKKLGENKVLSFTATLVSNDPDDKDRRFVVMYFVQDNTMKILEPPQRNSGFVGGTFLSRRSVKNPKTGENFNEKDIYIGAKLSLLNHVFLLHETNEGTLYWMEEHQLPKANVFLIIQKLRPVMFNDASNGQLALKFQENADPSQIDKVSRDGLRTVLASYGLIGDDEYSQLVEHEVLTLSRIDENKSKVVEYANIISLILNPVQDYE